MPLLNMMVICEDVIPVVVSICDCTDHMSDAPCNCGFGGSYCRTEIIWRMIILGNEIMEKFDKSF